jgi:hypothetical protein
MTPTSPGATLFAEIGAELRERPGVDEGVMLQSVGLRVDAKLFAFVGKDDRLIVKLPRERAEEAVAGGAATAVVMGKRTMKEWVAYAYREDDAGWRAALEEALAYVATLPRTP